MGVGATGGCNSMILSMTDVVAGYGAGNVLQGVDLGVESGSITCIIGPNGAGKSTVLRTISGLLRPDRGTISFADRSIERLPCDAILELGIAQVPQHQALFDQMTIRENILMGGYVLRKDRALIRKRYEAVEDLIPLLRERASEKAGNLSGGERRMIEFGRCLMLEPKMIMIDEPSLGLDPKSLGHVSELILLANEQGRTVLLVEQNVRLGLEMATHGVVMEAGRVRLQGSPKDILSNPDLAGLYLGGSIEKGGAHPAIAAVQGIPGVDPEVEAPKPPSN
jgi:ABC-type branched-subunit amino acid transport system ATPase component